MLSEATQEEEDEEEEEEEEEDEQDEDLFIYFFFWQRESTKYDGMQARVVRGKKMGLCYIN